MFVEMQNHMNDPILVNTDNITYIEFGAKFHTIYFNVPIRDQVFRVRVSVDDESIYKVLRRDKG